MNRTKPLARLAAVLGLTAMLATSAVAGHGRHHGDASPQAMAEHHERGLQKLFEAVDATPAQQAQIRALSDAARPDAEALFQRGADLRQRYHAAKAASDEATLASLRAEKDALRAEGRALHEEKRAAIGAVLTDAQREALATREAAWKARHGDRDGKHHRHGERHRRGAR